MKVYLSNGMILELTTQEFDLLFPGQINQEKVTSKKKYRHHKKQRFPRKGQSNWSAFLAKLRRQRKEKHESNPVFTKNCEICNNSYIARTRRQKFCSIPCKKKAIAQKYLEKKQQSF